MNLWDYAKLPENELLSRISEAKRKIGAAILAHNYQRIEVQRIADFKGDSLELARKANEVDAPVILFCGVMFMAETAKILNPERTVLIPDSQAGCPLAAHASADDVMKLKEQYPNHAVITYINSSAEVKAISDIACTSSNAVKVVWSIPDNNGIIFIPDKNLCHYVRTQTKRKDIICWDGHCYVHDRFTIEDVKNAREKYPQATIIVHPECPPDVQNSADVIASTSGMRRWVEEHRGIPAVLGTEIGMVDRLHDDFPETPIYPMSAKAVCSNMKLITLPKVARALEQMLYPVEVPTDIADKARLAIERMLEIK